MPSPAKHSRWQKDDGFYQFQHTINGDAQDPEWQRQQPEYGIKHQGQQRQRPAQEEQQAPEQEREHRLIH